MNNKKENEDDISCMYKLLLLGDSAVGKTCLLLRYSDSTFQEMHLSTIGLDYRLKTVSLGGGKKVKVQIWDTAGQDRFYSITKNYYKGAQGILLVFDITDFGSFSHTKKWLEQIREETSENTVIYLIGNKSDLSANRSVDTNLAIKIAEENGLKYRETSAKSGYNIDQTFTDLITEIDGIYSQNNYEMISGNKIRKKIKVNMDCCK